MFRIDHPGDNDGPPYTAWYRIDYLPESYGHGHRVIAWNSQFPPENDPDDWVLLGMAEALDDLHQMVKQGAMIRFEPDAGPNATEPNAD